MENLFKKIGVELKVNPTLSYSPSLNTFKASVPDVSLKDINGNHIPNYFERKTAEEAVMVMYLTLTQSLISVYSYPKDEDFAFVEGRFERVFNVSIEATESA